MPMTTPRAVRSHRQYPPRETREQKRRRRAAKRALLGARAELHRFIEALGRGDFDRRPHADVERERISLLDRYRAATLTHTPFSRDSTREQPARAL